MTRSETSLPPSFTSSVSSLASPWRGVSVVSTTLPPQQTTVSEEPSHRADGRAFSITPMRRHNAGAGQAQVGRKRKVGGVLLWCDGAN